MKTTPLRQPIRVAVALGDLVLLLVLAKYLNGTVLPPFGISGLWFYAAFAALLLGDFLIEPYFTRPADAIANGVALLIAVSSVAGTGAEVSATALAAGRIFFLVYGFVIVGFAITAIGLKDQTGRLRWVASYSTATVARIGSSRVVFSALLFAVGFAAFAHDSGKIAVLYLGWIVIFVIRPLDTVVAWSRSLLASRKVAGHGAVEVLEDPGTVVARLASDTRPVLGTRVKLGTSAELATVVDTTRIFDESLVRIAVPANMIVSVGDRVTVLRETSPEQVVGHVSQGSDIQELTVDTTAQVPDAGLAEGRLLSVRIRGQPVLYQITGGQIATAKLAGITRDIIRVTARKLGVWHQETTTFDQISWVPDPGALVNLPLEMGEAAFDPKNIGHVPSTSYGIAVDIHQAVMYNTAIIGILGIGKTHLAWELIQRALASGIKVVALDITGKYSQHLSDLFPPEKEEEIGASIQARIAGNLENATVRDNEAGNLLDFIQAMGEVLERFISGPELLLVLNPNRFEVSRLQGNPFQGRANLLVRLTMVEITRYIAEKLLRLVQSANPQPPAGQATIWLVLEEAHSLVPEWNSTTSEAERQAVNATARALLQGRKYGYGCLLVTQRTANVTKSILNQCNTIFGMRVYDATGMEFLENYVGPSYARLLVSLKDRCAVVFGRASSCNAPIIVELNDATAFDDGFWEPEKESILNKVAQAVAGQAPPAPIAEQPNVDPDDIPF